LIGTLALHGRVRIGVLWLCELSKAKRGGISR
jgi:hypothetical protein